MFWIAAVFVGGYISLVYIGVNDAFTRHGILFGLFLVFAFVQWKFRDRS
jgi:hypothetical protein